MEPKTQVEIQLGHMCNNRCVFCVSGQETELGRALPLEAEPILERIREAYTSGHRKLTILGGEPTLQPAFFQVLRHALALGFEEIVIFTNGVKTAREGFIDEVLELGDRFTWRISLQGANKEHHERTTKKPGSFDRIVASLENLRKRSQRITINMCVVQSNYVSIDEFPELLAKYGVRQLHLDMVRPLDAGERSEAEYRAMLPRYSDLATPLQRMVRGFPDGFDVNIGNLPYCVAPELSPWIHHDGETTYTVAVDGDNALSRPWDKYFVKRRDKLKPESCKACIFDVRCSGIFEKYREIYGTEELVPVTAARLRQLDPDLRLLGVHLGPVVQAIEAWAPPAPFERVTARVSGDREARITLYAGDSRVVAALRAPGSGAASVDLFSLHVLELPDAPELASAGLRALWSRVVSLGHRIWHPLGDDCVPGRVSAGIAARLAKLRQSAPFDALEWRSLEVGAGGREATLALVGPEGERAAVWLEQIGGQVRGGYRLDDGIEPTPAIVAGLGAVLQALRAGRTARRTAGRAGRAGAAR